MSCRIKIVAKAKKTQIVLSAHCIKQSGRTSANMELMKPGARNKHTRKSTIYSLCHIKKTVTNSVDRVLRKIGSKLDACSEY